MALKIRVELLLDVEDDDASCYDAINEILRGQQRSFEPESCLIDYAIGKVIKSDISLDGYEEGDAWSAPINSLTEGKKG